MSEPSDSLQTTIFKELARLVEPLLELRDEQAVVALLTELGWQVPAEAAAGLASAQSAFDAVAAAVEAVIEAVYTAIAEEDPAALAAAAPKVQAVFAAAAKIKDGLTAGVDFFDNSKIKEPGTLFTRLSDYLLLSYVERRSPAVSALLTLAGLANRVILSPLPPHHHAQGYRSVDWEGIPRLFSRPSDHLAAVYGWGADDFSDPAQPRGGFDERLFFANFLLLTRALGAAGGEYLATDNVAEMRYPIFKRGSWGVTQSYQEFGLALRPVAAQPPRQRGLALLPYLLGAVSGTVELGPRWSLALQGALATTLDGLRLELRPKESPSISGLPTGAEAALALQFTQRPSTPTTTTDIFLIGSAGSAFFLRMRGFSAHAKLSASNDQWIEAGLDIGELAITLTRRALDSFLAKVLPAEGVNVTAGIGLSVVNGQPIQFKGSGGLEFSLPLNQSLGGVVNILSVYFALRGSNEGLAAVVAATGSLVFGPLSITVDRIGLSATLLFVKDQGPTVAIGFKPPDGLGLAVKAGPISGGGYLFIDHANGRYAGILQLKANQINIAAIGLLDTRLPGGAKGFSFLIIITAKFPPIQLGYGFSLTGLGGLAGIHRSIVVQALQDSVRSGTAGQILFPDDPVKNAPRLISDLQAIFPPTENSFVFGPMAAIAWGRPARIVEAELGIIIQLPRLLIILLGQVNITLPDADAPAAELHLDIAGVLDIPGQLLAIDASLRDSKLVGFPLTGDMAMRLTWGTTPNFALAVGGLHPQFQPPPEFPLLKRVSLSIQLGEQVRLLVQAYTAITANSLQFGARGELTAEVGGFSLSATLGFDVLISFPFAISADLFLNAALRRGSQLLATVTLDAHLTGPTPWHVWGKAKVSVLFLSVEVAVDEIIGEEAHYAIAVTSPWAQLKAEVARADNWTPLAPPAVSAVVSLALPGEGKAAHVLIDPLGGLTLRQKVVPLDHTLTQFGQAPLDAPERYTVEKVLLAANHHKPAAVYDFFAPAQFTALSDAQKLSRPSFEQMQAGLSFAGDDVGFGALKRADYSYKQVIVDGPEPPADMLQLRPRQHEALLGRSAAARAALASGELDMYAPLPGTPALVSLDDDTYVIVDVRSLSEVPIAIPAPQTKTAASQALEKYLAQNPAQRGRLQVVPRAEK